MTSGGSLPEKEAARAAAPENLPVKLEIVEEDTLEEEHGSLRKRAKAYSDLEKVWI